MNRFAIVLYFGACRGLSNEPYKPYSLPLRAESSRSANLEPAPLKKSLTLNESTRRKLFYSLLGSATCLNGVSLSAVAAEKGAKSRTEGYTVQKTKAEWSNMLSQVQFDVLRNGATERPGSSILVTEYRSGIFKCAGCANPLFSSSDKFNSRTGWPSFASALAGAEVDDAASNSLSFKSGLAGAELRCRNCGGHLGDVFNDGKIFVGTPAFVTGRRFCIDGSALVFSPSSGEKEPQDVRGDTSPPRPASDLPNFLKPPAIVPVSKAV
mmetsp:Transcript_39557/g.77297  ORF Transcript_39557/g.77297 Transcript_39557/m.77297 type:complete len:267 (+) Transcript_39557:151-951(+)|eukprot:CAMPEP_0194310076 /NCGR_PEP_ID=MMETSP0171-20130528/7018_1 /TAXON_ID=218684 /ORGANISM="Corethron pennatum, Strain L29A3" /LENGTH=266 /DNA_ID=CAMNT_0039063521 /DNA_START=88 /DNA_END=888 /DNA_ORIENTATION=-